MEKNTIKFQEVLNKLDESLLLASEIVTSNEERAKLGVHFNNVLEILWKNYKKNILETRPPSKEVVREKEVIDIDSFSSKGGVSYYEDCSAQHDFLKLSDKELDHSETFIPIDTLSQVYKDLIDIVTKP